MLEMASSALMSCRFYWLMARGSPSREMVTFKKCEEFIFFNSRRFLLNKRRKNSQWICHFFAAWDEKKNMTTVWTLGFEVIQTVVMGHGSSRWQRSPSSPFSCLCLLPTRKGFGFFSVWSGQSCSWSYNVNNNKTRKYQLHVKDLEERGPRCKAACLSE